jgi:flagellar biosynthetic protein FliR
VNIQISVAWALGIALAIARSGAFIALCAFVPRSIPRMARGTLAIAIGVLIASPVQDANMGAGELAVNAFTNLVLGAVLGWFLGLAVAAFEVAGTLVDLGSGVTLGSVFDPETGGTPGPFTRFYTVAVQALIVAGGGLMLVTQILWASTKAVALDGRLVGLRALGPAAADRFSEMFRFGVQLALPVVALLFVAELAFGLLSRMAPQINMFLIALPVKTLLAIALLGTAAAMFPAAVDQVFRSGVDSLTRFIGN